MKVRGVKFICMKIKCPSCLKELDKPYSWIKSKLSGDRSITCSRSCTNRISQLKFRGCSTYSDIYRRLKYLTSEECKSELITLTDKNHFSYEIAEHFGVSSSYVVRNIRYHLPNYDLVGNQNKRQSERMKSGEVYTWTKNPELQTKLSPFLNPEYQKNNQKRMRDNLVGIYDLNMKPGNHRWYSGKFFSIKLRKELIYRSSFELNTMRILEKDPNVILYLYEPVFIRYTDNNYYKPDFLVWYLDNTIKIIEVKPSGLVDNPKNQLKFDAARKYCNDNGYEFEIWTEDIIHIKLNQE